MALLNPITLNYNGIQFNETQIVTASMRMIEDAARRTVVETQLTLKVRAKVLEGDDQDTEMDAIRAALERPGGQLLYAGAGFGTLEINMPGGKKDLNWGPKPRILEWRPIGRDRAAEITWAVEVSLIGCRDSTFQGNVMEANYSLSIRTDHAGYATRTHTGMIRIPMTRIAANNPNIPDSADNYFEQWCPGAFPGFERTIDRRVDESKTRLTFTVVDTQLKGNPLPPGIAKARATYSTKTVTRGLFTRYAFTIDAEYEVSPPLPRSIAFDAFMTLVNNRLRDERNAGATGWIPLDFSISEDVYGPSIRFTASIEATKIIGKGRNWIPLLSFFRPDPLGDWGAWHGSLVNSARHARGLSKLGDDGSSDIIVDPCLNRGGHIAEIVPNGKLTGGQPKDSWSSMKTKMGIEDEPPPFSTWLHYQCAMVAEGCDATMMHVPLPEKKEVTAILATPGGGAFRHIGPGFYLDRQETPPPIIQRSTSPVYYVRIVGEAVRFAYEIPMPQLQPIGGKTPVPANDPSLGTFWEHKLAAWTCFPIYTARWNLRFAVPRNANSGSLDLPLMAHPDQQQDV